MTALDMRQDRLDFCREALGVDHTVAAGPDTLARRCPSSPAGDFFDVVIDATGKASR